MSRVLLVIVVLIVYGSLYPWHFVARPPDPLAPAAANPLWILAHAWTFQLNRWAVRDVVVNIALYVPLGMSAYFTFLNSRFTILNFRFRGARYFGPVMLGVLLSATIEMVQVFEPARNTSAIDLMCNTAGSILGVLGAIVFGGELQKLAGVRIVAVSADRPALALLFTWAGVQFYPLIPVLGGYELFRKLKIFGNGAWFSPLPLISAACVWFAVGLLLEAAEAGAPRALLGLALLTIPAQFMVVYRQPLPVELLGALLGVSLFAFRKARAPAHKWEAWAFLGLLVVRGLAPFRWTEPATEFTWIPFGGLLAANWQPAIGVLLEKCFYYGIAIWLFRASGARLREAVAVVFVTLGAIEFAQIHLPGRTPEITDPLMALLLGFGFLTLSRETGTRFRSQE